MRAADLVFHPPQWDGRQIVRVHTDMELSTPSGDAGVRVPVQQPLADIDPSSRSRR